MNQLTKVFEENNLTILEVEGDFHFLLKDLCEILGLSNPRMVKDRLDDDVSSTYPIQDRLGRTQQATFVNEDGLYDVILDSRKPEAKKFRKWITSEVLPSIRKTGAYGQPGNTKLLLRAALEQEERIEVVETDVKYLMDNMRVSKGQETELQALGKSVVIKALGGFESNAYRKIGSKVFPKMWGEFKRHFGIPRYGELPKARFEEGLEFIKEWAPDTSLKLKIKELNNQQHLKLVD